MYNKNDVTILVNSCDKYEDAWEPFFKLFSIQWPDCPYRIILNTESKTFDCDYLSVETVHTGDCKTWTERVKKVLKEIDTEFVLFTLEDFFLLSPVSNNAWEDALSKMKKHSYVGFMWFPPNGSHQPTNCKRIIDMFLYETKKDCCVRINATLGLWRKEYLQQMLFRDGDAWYFEWSATKLSKYSNFMATFWDQKNFHIFDYEISPEAGYGIVRGKWLSRNQELFKKYNITVNFENLGIINYSVSYVSLGLVKPEPKNKLIKRIQRFLKRAKRYMNDIKRFPKLYFKFKKYCKTIHKFTKNTVEY